MTDLLYLSVDTNSHLLVKQFCYGLDILSKFLYQDLDV